MEFSNARMRVPRPGKPHIAFIQGYWRVSPLPNPYCPKLASYWFDAYQVIGRLNK